MNHKKFTGQINSENDIHLKIHQDFRNLEQKLYQVQQEKDDLIVENRKLRNQLTDCEERCLHLTAQLCAYKEDFETERSDRERAQGSLIDLNLKVQQLQQELDRQVQHGEDKQQQLQNDVHKQGLYTRNQSLEQKRSCTLNDQSSQQEEFLLPQQQRQQRQQQSHSQQQREQKTALQQQLKQQPWQEPQLQQPYQQQQQASGKFERQQGLNQNQQQRQQCYQQQLKLKQQQQRVQQQQQLSDTPVVQNGQIEKQQRVQILERRRLLESVDKQQQQLQQKQFKCDEKQTRQSDCGPIHRSRCSIDNYDRFDDVTQHLHYHSVSHDDSDDNTAEDVYSAACMTIHPANQNSTTCTSSALSEFIHHSCTAPMSQVSSAPRRPFVGGVASAGKNNFSDLEISSRPVASTTFTESSGLNTPATVAELSSGRYHETEVRNSDLDRTVPKIIPAACGSTSEEDNNVTSERYVKNAAGFSKTCKPPCASHVSSVCIANTVAHSKYVDSFCKSGMHAKHASDADPLHIENDNSNAFTGDASSAAAINTGAATCPVSVAAAASSASTYAIVGSKPNALRNVDITTSIDAENTTNNNNKQTNSSASKLLTHRITEAIPGAVTAAAVVVYPLVDKCDKFNISSSAILDTSDTTLAAALPDTHRKTSATVAVAGRGDTAADAVGGRSDTAADAGGGAGYFKMGGTNLDSTGNLKTVSKTSSIVETSRYLYEADSATFEGSTNVQTLEPFHQRPPPAEKQSEVTDLHGGHERVQREKVSLQNVTSSGLTRYGHFSNQDNDHRSPDDIQNLKTNGLEHCGNRFMNLAEETSKRSDSENVGITKPVKNYTSEGKPIPCHLRYGSATAKCRPNTPNELITGEKAKFPFYGHEYKPHTTAQYLELESDTARNHDYSFSRNDDRNNMKHDRIDHTSDHTSDHNIDRTNSAIQMLPQKPYYNTDAGYEYYDNELNQTRDDNAQFFAHNAVNDDYDDIDAGDDCNTDTQRHHSYQTGADDAASGIQCQNESAESRTGVELTGSSTEESLRCPVCNESFTAAQQHMLLDHILNVCLQ